MAAEPAIDTFLIETILIMLVLPFILNGLLLWAVTKLLHTQNRGFWRIVSVAGIGVVLEAAAGVFFVVFLLYETHVILLFLAVAVVMFMVKLLLVKSILKNSWIESTIITVLWMGAGVYLRALILLPLRMPIL